MSYCHCAVATLNIKKTASKVPIHITSTLILPLPYPLKPRKMSLLWSWNIADSNMLAADFQHINKTWICTRMNLWLVSKAANTSLPVSKLNLCHVLITFHFTAPPVLILIFCFCSVSWALENSFHCRDPSCSITKIAKLHSYDVKVWTCNYSVAIAIVC
jgi:hypothetical protein